ncbi:Cuticle protein CP14.6 [Gryllus bimaculatus]|nr:Cuticle protein CP14.6 [Gryllus bimaculatus]
MNSMILVVALCAAVAVALPRPDAELRPGVIPVLQRTDVRDDVGQFSLSYLSGDGTSVSEQGALKPTADHKDHVLVKQGSYQYTSPEGELIKVTYVADEGGFRPEGSHIPVAPVATTA